MSGVSKTGTQERPAKRAGGLRALLPLLLLVAAGVALWAVDQSAGRKAAEATLANLQEMLLFLPPVFILLGLLDVWVPRERIVALMGEGSGLKGIVLAFFLGSAAAGPLYGAFPVAQVLIKKGASLRYILILLGAWSTTKIPMLMFELANLGVLFTLTRLVLNLVGIAGMALLLDKLIPQGDRRIILEKAEQK